jgi:selenophosphate synthetase-related protein
MDLLEFAESLRNSPQIKKKYELHPTMEFFKEFGYKNERIYAAFGQDSAAITTEPDSQVLTLMTIDEISKQFLIANPQGAGYSSLFVASDDIYACGGLPIATCISISAKDQDEVNLILEGINRASKLLNLPVVRGHTSLAQETHLTVAAIGTIEKDLFISAGGAMENDAVALIIDPQGEPSKTNRSYWNSIHEKISNMTEKRRIIYHLSKAKCIHSSKDISNSGIFGTLLQMMELSNIGAKIDIMKIIIPETLVKEKYTIEEYAKMYLTSSFIVTLDPNKIETAKRIAGEHGLELNVIGSVIKSKKIIIAQNNNEIELFNFEREKLIF